MYPRLAALLLATLFVSGACTPDDTAKLYHTEPHAPSLDPDAIANLDHLGPTIIDRGVNFGVYSERATRIDLLLFEDPESSRPVRQFTLDRFGDVWNLYVEGVGVGQHYGYVAWGPNWPEHPDFFPGSIHGFISDVDVDGNRFNPNKLLTDPYAKAVHRDHNWTAGSNASGPGRTDSTYDAAAKSVVWAPHYPWSDNEAAWRATREDADAPGHGWNDLVVYEVHPKGFTASPASGVDHPGTYLGFAEKADYLADLGITAVEMMPIHEKPLNGGYWGYMTLNFFAPEHSYAFDRDPRDVIAEFKHMVDELHKRDIEVIIDVVYNHTGEGGLWREKIEQDDVDLDPFTSGALANFDPKEVASLYSFRGLDNHAYYALAPDNQTYWNNTGVGNETRANHTPMTRLILDSLRFYVEELHVDGFRFDLAPILGERDYDYNNWDEVERTVLQAIIDDPVLQKYNTRIIAEPWAAGGNESFKLGAFPPASGDAGAAGVGWFEWNAYFRDWWRAFLNDDAWLLSSREGPADGGFTMTGSFDLFAHNQRRPYHSVNFLTVHDGFTLYDVFSYDTKRNACGPLNPVCCDEPFSPFCDRDSGENNNRSRNWGDEDFKRQQIRNSFAALMLSHGTPLILGGDEWMRTQLGNNNAYSTGADNEFNWFDWGSWQASDERTRMHDFVRGVIALRKELSHAFAPSEYGASAPFAFKAPDNTDAVNFDGRALMIHYYDDSAGAELLILLNMDRGATIDFTLPAGRSWQRRLDTQGYFDTLYLGETGADPRVSHNVFAPGDVIPTASYGASPNSIVILEAVTALE
jgi:glycogen operon protein